MFALASITVALQPFGSQTMIALEPFIRAIFNLPDYRKFALMMERDENIQKLTTMIEIANREQKSAEKSEKRKHKRRRFRSTLK